MEYNIRAEERKRFLHYFRFWIIALAVLLVIWGILLLLKKPANAEKRNNSVAPDQRVYDYADILTDAEEKRLAQVIAECEEKGKCDIILVTAREEMGLDDDTWNYNMMNYADDFYDERAFGYNAPHGSGALLLDNWYEDENGSQKGTWLSTSGKMEDIIGVREEDTILDALEYYISSDPAKAYEMAIRKIAYWGDEESRSSAVRGVSVFSILLFSTIVAVVYAVSHLVQKAGKDTTLPTTYVAGGRPRMRAQRDDFIRKSVTSVRIQTDSGSSGRSSGHHSGGGSAGHHTSSGGHSHGGGGRRR